MPKNHRPTEERFDLEPLEDRILLSADVLASGTDFAKDELVYQHLESNLVVQGDSIQQFQDPLAADQVAFQRAEAVIDSVPATVTSGLVDLRSMLSKFGDHFNLSSQNLPVLPNALDSIFDFTSVLENSGLEILPEIQPATDLESLADSLTGAGYTVLGVLDGIEGKYDSTTDGSYIRVSISKVPSAPIPVKPGQENSLFNNQTPSLLLGLSGQASSIGAQWEGGLLANLALSLNFGVGADGTFFVEGNSVRMETRIQASAVLSGSANVAGSSGVAVNGTADVDLTVGLKVSEAGVISVDGLVDRLTSGSLAEVLDGGANLQLEFTAGSSSMNFTSSYAYADGEPVQNPDVHLSGELFLPGVKDIQGNVASLELAANYDPSSDQWDLTAAPKGGETLFFHAIELQNFKLNLTINSDSYSGNTEGILQFDDIRTTDGSLTLNFEATVDQTGYSIDTIAHLGDLSFHESRVGPDGSKTSTEKILMDVKDVQVSFKATGQYANADFTAVIGFESTEADILPGQSFSIHGGDTTGTDAGAITGSLDILKEDLHFELSNLEVKDEGVFLLSATTLVVNYERGKEEQTLATLDSGTLRLLNFKNNPVVDLTPETDADGNVLTPGFTLYSNGFEVVDLQVNLDNVQIGSTSNVLLDAGATELELKNFKYTVGQAPSGTMELRVEGHVDLLPGSHEIICRLIDSASTEDGESTDKIALQGSFNLGTGSFSLAADALELEVKSAFGLLSSGTTVNPGVQFNFDPEGGDTQELFTLSQFDLTLYPFKINGTALNTTGSGLTVTPSSLSLANMEIPSPGTELGTIEIDNGRTGDARKVLFAIDNPDIILKDITLTSGGFREGSTIFFSSSKLELLPGNENLSSQITDTNADGKAFDGKLSLGSDGLQEFQLNIDRLDIESGDLLSFAMTDATFDIGGDVIFNDPGEIDVVVDKSGLNLQGKLQGLSVKANGDMSFTEIGVDATQLNNKLGLAGFLPLVIDGFDVQSLDGTLHNLNVSVTARFDIDKLASALPFTPIVQLQDPNSGDPASHGKDDAFTFKMGWRNGALVPLDIPSITLGIKDFKVGHLAVLSGQITLGAYVNGEWSGNLGGSLSLLPNEHMSNIKQGTSDPSPAQVTAAFPLYADDSGLSVTLSPDSVMDIEGGKLDLHAEFLVSFDLKEYLHFENLELDFHFNAEFSPSAFTFGNLAVAMEGLSFTNATMSFKELIRIETTNGAVNFAPKEGQNLVEFSSMDVRIGELGIEGTVNNLNIGANGDLLVQENFAIALEFDPADSPLFEKIKFPTWMPKPGNGGFSIVWSNFNSDPDNFDLTVSGSINGLTLPGTQLGLSGDIEGLKLIIDGDNFVIDSVEDVKFQVGGLAFGIDIEGELELGMYRFDNDGDLIDPTDPSQSNTPVAERVVFGTAAVDFVIESLGLRLFLGFSEYELFAFVFAEAEIPVGAETGVSIQQLYAQIRTNPTDLEAVDSAKDLGTIKLAPNQTLTDKIAAFKKSLLASVQAGTSLDLSHLQRDLEELSIEGGVVLNDIYTQSALTLALDLRIDGGKRFLATGMLNTTQYGDLDLKVYFDLSGIHASGEAEDGSILIYTGLESKLLSKAPITLYGALEAKAGAGSDSLTLGGGVLFSLDGVAELELEGLSTFSMLTDKHYNLSVDGDVKVTGFGKIIAMKGNLLVDVDDQGNQQIYGALAIEPKQFEFLKEIGIQSEAIAVWRLNFTNEDKSVELKVGDNPVQTFLLPASSVSTHVEGLFTVRENGHDWIGVHGSADLYESDEAVDVILEGEVRIGPAGSIGPGSTADDAWLRLDALGYLRLEPLYGIAGELSLTLKEGGKIKDLLGNDGGARGVFSLRINTLGKDISYEIPTEYNDKLQSGTIQLPGVSPEIMGGQVGDQAAAWMYIQVEDGYLNLHESLQVKGNFALVVATDKMEARLDGATVSFLSGQSVLMDLKASGALQIDSSGAAGALTVDLSDLQLDDGAVSFEGTALWMVNTTGVKAVLPGPVGSSQTIDVPAGENGDPYSRLEIQGTMAINEPASSTASFPGHHIFQLVSNSGQPGYHLTLSSITTLTVKVADEVFLTCPLSGAGMVDDSGLAAFFQYQDANGNTALSGTAFDDANVPFKFDSLYLGINTSGSDLSVTRSGDEIKFVPAGIDDQPPGSLAWLPSKVGAQVNLAGTLGLFEVFKMTGDFQMTFDDNRWTIETEGNLDLITPDHTEEAFISLPFSETIHLNLPGIVFSQEFSTDNSALDAFKDKLKIDPSNGYKLSIEVNTTKDADASTGLEAGPFARLNLTEASLHFAGFELNGDFHFESNALSSLQGSGDFDVLLKEGGKTLMSSHAHGDIHLGFDGLAGSVGMAKPELLGFEFQNSDQSDQQFFSIDFNTSGKAYSFESPNGSVVIPAGPFAEAHLHATFNFLNLDAIVLTGDIDLGKDGQMHMDVDLEAYLISKSIDSKPLVSIPLKGDLIHNASGTTGDLKVSLDTSQGGLDFPDDWGISFGKTDNDFMVSFNLVHDSSSSSATDGDNKPADTAPADGFQISFNSRTVIGLNQINGTVFLSWVRGQQLRLGLDGSTYLGFGDQDSEGRPSTTLFAMDVGGFLDWEEKGFFGGFEVDLEAGDDAVQDFFESELGMRIGLDASAKAYLFVNTTGKDQTLEGMPDSLQHLPTDRKFEMLLNTKLDIASIEMEGMFGFSLFSDGFLLRVSAHHEIALYRSADEHGTALRLGGSTIAGVLEIRHSGGQKGVVGFLAGEANLPTVNVGGFQLLKNDMDLYFRLNTTGKEVDLSGSDYLPDLANVSESIKELLHMPAGHYGQIIASNSWTVPPFIGTELEATLIAEYVNDSNIGKALFLQYRGSLYYQMMDVAGIHLGRAELKGDFFGLIDSDHNVALAANLDTEANFANSKFLGIDLGLPDINPTFQLKTQDRAFDLNPYIPEHFKDKQGDYLKFGEGQYAKIVMDVTLTEKVLDIGFDLEGKTELEFKHRKVSGKDDAYYTWIEAESEFSSTAYLTSLLGQVKDSITAGIYIGSGGFAVVADYEYTDTQHAKWADVGFHWDKWKLSVNTTGREIQFSDATVSASYAQLTTGGTMNLDLFSLEGKFDFELKSAAAGWVDVEWSAPTPHWGPPDSGSASAELPDATAENPVTLSLFGQEISFTEPVFQLHSDGLIGSFSASESLHLATVAEIGGAMWLEVNTTGRRITGFANPIDPHTIQISIRDADLKLAGITFNGGLSIKASASGGLHVEVDSDNPLAGEVFGLGGIQLSGELTDSEVDLKGAFSIGDPSLAHMDAAIEIGYEGGILFKTTGDIFIFGKQLKSLQLDSPDKALQVNINISEDIVLPNDFVRLSGSANIQIDTNGLKVSGTKFGIYVHGTHLDGTVSMNLDTSQKKWSAKGDVSLGGSKSGDVATPIYAAVVAATEGKWDTVYLTTWFINGNLTFHVDLGSNQAETIAWDFDLKAGINYYENHLHGRFWPEYKKDYYSISKSMSASGSLNASSSKLHAHVKFTEWAVTIIDETVTVDLNHLGWIKGSDLKESRVFLDANHNGVEDEGEPATHADDIGNFTFLNTDFAGNLGSLTPFDTDGDGQISPNEGVFVIHGGTDLNTGLENTMRYVVSAEGYGDLFQDVYSPLAMLHHELEKHGLSQSEAWDSIRAMFDIPGTVNPATFDPNHSEEFHAEAGYHHDVEAAYAQLSVFMANGYRMLQGYFPELDDGTVQAALLHELGGEMAVAHAGGEEGTLLLTDKTFVERVLKSTYERLGGDLSGLGSVDAFEASAHIISVQSTFIEYLKLAEVDQVTERMALVKKEALLTSSPLLTGVALGNANGVDLIQTYTLSSLLDTLNASSLPLNNQPTLLRPINPVSLSPGGSTTIHLEPFQFDGRADEFSWEITSSNENLVPSGNISVSRSDTGAWVLNVRTDGAFRGESIITLKTKETAGGEGNPISFSVKVDPTISLGDLTYLREGNVSYLILPVGLDYSSSKAVTGAIDLNGTALTEGFVVDSVNTFKILPGETSTSLRIPLLRTPYSQPASLEATLDAVANASVGVSGKTASITLPQVNQPGNGAGHTSPNAFSPDSMRKINPLLESLLEPDPSNEDAQRIQPDKLDYQS